MPENTPRNTWLRESEEVLVRCPVLEIARQDCRSSEDPSRSHSFYVMHSRDWCNIIPVTEDGKVVLVSQYRPGIEAKTLEIPGGVSDASDHDIAATALRELAEETGYQPLPGARCVRLGWTHPNPAIQDNRCHSLIVGPVRKTGEQNLDPGEMIDVLEVPLEELPERIARTEINHALMLNTFFLLMMSRPDGAGALRAALREFVRAPA